jgi:hypothetical protein
MLVSRLPTLGGTSAYEVDLALEHLKHTQANDLIIFDRNYLSIIFLAKIPPSSGQA